MTFFFFFFFFLFFFVYGLNNISSRFLNQCLWQAVPATIGSATIGLNVNSVTSER